MDDMRWHHMTSHHITLHYHTPITLHCARHITSRDITPRSLHMYTYLEIRRHAYTTILIHTQVHMHKDTFTNIHIQSACIHIHTITYIQWLDNDIQSHSIHHIRLQTCHYTRFDRYIYVIIHVVAVLACIDIHTNACTQLFTMFSIHRREHTCAPITSSHNTLYMCFTNWAETLQSCLVHSGCLQSHGDATSNQGVNSNTYKYSLRGPGISTDHFGFRDWITFGSLLLPERLRSKHVEDFLRNQSKLSMWNWACHLHLCNFPNTLPQKNCTARIWWVEKLTVCAVSRVSVSAIQFGPMFWRHTYTGFPGHWEV